MLNYRRYFSLFAEDFDEHYLILDFCAYVQMQLIYGWSISVLLLVLSLLGPAKMGNVNYQYNAYDAAVYAALSPISWCAIFAWVIYTTHIGYSSKIFQSFFPLQKFPQ